MPDLQPIRDSALLTWVQEHAPFGIITLNKSLEVQTWNHWMEQHSLLKASEVHGKNILSLYPDLRDRNLTGRFERALQGESSVISTALHRYLLPFPCPLREPGFPNMRQTARIMPLLSEDVICGVAVVIEDVTLRESQSETLRRQHHRDEILSWALAHLLKTEEPHKAIRPLFFKVAEHFDFDTFFLSLRDPESGQYESCGAGGVLLDSGGLISQPLLAAISEARQVIIYNAEETDESHLDILKGSGISALIAIPLFADHHTLGLLCFGTATRKSLGTEEIQLLTNIGQYLSIAVDRHNTSQELQKTREKLFAHSQALEKTVQDRTFRLRETIAELETFSYTLAHDLKAPVRGMTGYCHVLLEDYADALPEEVKALIKRLMRTAYRAEALIHDILAFSKITQVELHLTSIDIPPLVENVLSARGPDVQKAVTLRLPMQPVRAHRALLQQVLSNLIDNAVKFVKPGQSPVITLSTEEISEGSPSLHSERLVFSSIHEPSLPFAPAPAPGRLVRVWIQDEGIGIARDAHQKIFGIFERATTEFEGNGMGLAIVARAIQRMGGNCGVESEEGSGSRFWIELPAGN